MKEFKGSNIRSSLLKILEVSGRMEEITKERPPGRKGFWGGRYQNQCRDVGEWKSMVQRNREGGKKPRTVGIIPQVCVCTGDLLTLRRKYQYFCLFSMKIKTNEALVRLVQIDTRTCLKQRNKHTFEDIYWIIFVYRLCDQNVWLSVL